MGMKAVDAVSKGDARHAVLIACQSELDRVLESIACLDEMAQGAANLLKCQALEL